MAAKDGLKSLHDRLLAEKPDGANHDSDTCPLCAMDDSSLDTPGGAVTYTEEELQAAVDKAVAAMQARVTELEQSQQVSEVESAKAALRAELQTTVDDLQSQLDAAVLKAEAAERERDEIKAWLDAEATAQAEAEAIQARKEERLTKIREAASFPEDYLTQNADRFAAMSDDDFNTAVESWKAIAPAGTSTIPEKTALHAGRESESTAGSALKDVIALRRNGRIDLSTL